MHLKKENQQGWTENHQIKNIVVESFCFLLWSDSQMVYFESKMRQWVKELHINWDNIMFIS